MTGELLTLGLIKIVTIVSIRQHCCLSVGEAEWQVRPEEAHRVRSGVPLAGQAVTVSACHSVKEAVPQGCLYQTAWKAC